MGKIEDVTLDQIQINREGVLGTLVYAGVMGNHPVTVRNPDHSQHVPTKHYLGSQYIDLLTGEPAYIMKIDCRCCESGKHDYQPAVKGSFNGDNAESTYIGRVCVYHLCGQLEPVEDTPAWCHKSVEEPAFAHS